jgi:glycosyltransferase involved in cell wall biosynthesis
MKILYIAHRIPYPPDRGDKIRSFNEIKYLSQRHEIHLACLADDPKDLKYENDLKHFCKSTNVVLVNPKIVKLKSSFYLFSKKPLSVPYFYSRKLQRSVDQLLSTNDYDAIFCFSSPMAEYVFKSGLLVSGFLKFEKSLLKGSPVTSDQKLASSVQRPATSSQQPETSKKHPATSVRQPATRIMDFVDVDSDKWGQYSKHARFPMSWVYALEGRRLADYERKVAETFDHSIFVTEAEAKIFRNKNLHIKNITAISNGVDLDYFSPTFSQHPSTINQPPETSTQHPETGNQNPTTRIHQPASSFHQPVIVFTGAMNYFANVDGVVWFTKEILPLIRKEIPEIRFYIVGSNPAKEVLSLSSDSGVTVTGYVPDTREYLNKAAVVVVPLRIARGIQNKILEAMAMGISVVATPQAFEGIEAQPGRDLVLGENAEKFGECVIKLIRKVSLRKSIGDNARRIVEKNYCWAKNLEKLDNVLME